MPVKCVRIALGRLASSGKELISERSLDGCLFALCNAFLCWWQYFLKNGLFKF